MKILNIVQGIHFTFHPQKKEALTRQMGNNTKLKPFQALVLILVSFALDCCTSTDTITSTQSITDPEYIVSNDKVFKLGFFTPVNSTNRYVGILYNIPKMTVVWVANREKPLNDSSGIVMISEEGNLLIMNGQKEIIWSSNVSNPSANSSAQLLDTGNLVLRDNSSGRILWETFQHPTDSFLQNMRLSADLNTDERILLTSWKSPSDPSVGNFSMGIDSLNVPQLYVWNGSHTYWRSGPWNGRVFIGFRNMASEYLNGFKLLESEEGTIYVTFTYANESIPTYVSLNSDGSVLVKAWSDGKEDWEVMQVVPLNEEKNINMKVVIAITTTIGSITLAICAYFSWRCIAKRRGRKQKREQDQIKVEELPLYSLQSMAHATSNFHSVNKLGQGGFGPVYKGKLPDGQEIAVKRLSRSSGQGLKEFMNEVVVISKLQHRNLVRLIGCCVEGEEKMLIYEYMPNKSLDAFLFDSLKQELLGWSTRVNIIEGIGRGLLYLHRDSRLRIIHRDLKASNILLDEQLNPKISDFGLAKIFGGNQDQADASRIVGTRGYMAPEYAMEGRFSEKSDVYSFGVLILEILSGRRNTNFYHDEHSLSLLRFAWKLWNEDKSITLADPKISNTQFRMEILRCIHVGLLCVQEFAKDRPTVSTVLSMLSSEIADLPTPKQPAFTERQISAEVASSQQSEKRCSINSVTITSIDGR